MRKLKLRLNELIEQKSEALGRTITQKEISQAIKVPEATISRYARGYTGSFNAEIVAKLCDYFGIDEPNGIFSLEDEGKK